MQIAMDQEYEGAFQSLGKDETGAEDFVSNQSVKDSSVEQLEVTSIRWSVAPDETLTGMASFITVKTHDTVNATLSGVSPAPPKGQNYREAHVTVTFDGGSRALASATGEAKVEAKLYDDGTSVGRLRGYLEIPD